MPIRRSIALLLLALALFGAWSGARGQVMVQQPAPTATTLPATPSPTPVPPTATAAPPTATPALPTPTPSPPLTPTVAPTPEPTLTVPQAFDRILSGQQPVETIFILIAQRPWWLVIGLITLALLIAGLVAIVKPWHERFLRWVDRKTGGQRIDIEGEVQREEEKKKVEGERKAQQLQAALPEGIARYLDWLCAEYGFTQPLGIATEQVQLSLQAVHVPLRVVEREAIEAYRQRMRGERQNEPGRDEKSGRYVFELLSEPELIAADLSSSASRDSWQRMFVEGAESDPPPATTTRLLLLGDAGSGKTTTLRYAALRLAEAYRAGRAALLAEPEAGLRLRLRQAPLPIYVRLTLFAATTPADLNELPVQERQRYAGAPPDLFLAWLDREAAKYCELPEAALSSLIKRNDGGVLLLLDGLDEAGDDQRRAYLAQVIDNLASRYNRQRYVVASRTAGYRGNVYLPTFLERHLSPLDRDEAQALIRKWFDAVYARLAAIGRRRQDAAADQAAELWEAIERNERLFEMAANPLLLTVMALLQFNNVRLPDQRAKLYEKLIELLLDLWRKQNVASDTLTMSVAQLASEQRRLEALALKMQQQPRQVREVTLRQAQEWLSPLYVERLKIDPEAADDRVRDLLHRLAVDSGIIQRREEMYSFSHYTFQEYLAARALDSLDNRDGEPDSVAFLLERAGDARWRETLLLAAGTWSNGQQLPKTERLLNGLLKTRTPEHLLLAADALADIGRVEELTDLRDRTTARLRALAALTDDWRTAAHPNPVLRNRAATMLDRLDADTDRPGLDLTSPDYWAARIEPGTFSMGDNNGEYDDEKQQFDCPIRRPYALARFPVTNRQYLLFVEALAGRGTPEALAAADRLKELMKRHGETPEKYGGFRPRSWPGARYRPGEGNHPVGGVTWYAATAFAWWVNAWLHALGALRADEEVRLPTEAEWERAAAYPLALPGGDPRAGRREYPWGDRNVTETLTGGMIASIRANTSESGIDGTSVVGIFPHGAAACDAQDMAGNVWEWCSTPPVPYPFEGEVDAETLYTANKRASKTYVLRGGSWYITRGFARCASRVGNPPGRADGILGLRLARLFSLPSS
ncbi:MAG: SUMF1/EgtB/PvdO family nonheme iron enzyme [Oscillochloridaceae bacterium]|nr:SUMF1/EgtB/PvdO family nonheme iron enzyme [Chloroflexaceae bacterium]MDW8390734.1 SUMF1/EgtB/PvdO family nonheme iron enzyme [Oscillochloridaceae bacterium]